MGSSVRHTGRDLLCVCVPLDAIREDVKFAFGPLEQEFTGKQADPFQQPCADGSG